MLPSQTQRLLMLLAVVVGTPAWWWAAGFLPPGDGLNGWALSDSRTGLGLAAGLVWAAALPAVIAAGLIAATGNPLSGVCCVALAGVIAHHGNSIVGVAQRAAELGNEAGTAAAVYHRLAIEMGVGVVMLIMLLVGLEAVRRVCQDRVPHRLQSRHLGGKVHLWKINGKSLIAGVITAAVGAVLTAVLVQSDNPQQVTGGLVLAFTLAALIGHAVVPNDRAWATLVAPAFVGIVGYLWTARQLGTTDTPDALLSALYTDALPGLALGLPLHYLTAGVLGSAIGIGIGQVVEEAKLGEL